MALVCRPQPMTAQGLTTAAALAPIYDDIMNADFTRASTRLTPACEQLPPAACHVLGATALWWQIQLDPLSPALDDQFLEAVGTAIESAEAWVEREPERAEAWFYLGGAYAVRVQWRVLRDQKLAAARDGKRIKNALERAIELDESLHDAYFGLGLYQYYADLAPAAAKMLRWFLFLPGGNREQGLQQMLRAQEKGELLRGEADYQLYLIYLWYEKQPLKASDLLERIRRRYASNPIFWLETARLEDTYLHNVGGSLEWYRKLLDAAEQSRVKFATLARIEARLGIARQLDALGDTDLAIGQLNEVIRLRPETPYGSLAIAHAQLGAAHDRLGKRELALQHYKAALDTAPPQDIFEELRDQSARALRSQPDARKAEAYRLSLEAWRLIERKALDRAAPLIERSLELNPSDAQTRYRRGLLLKARGQEIEALAEFNRVIQSRPPSPLPLLASAYLEAARLLERSSDREQAARLYEAASTAYGGSIDTREAARRALARLRTSGAATPSRR